MKKGLFISLILIASGSFSLLMTRESSATPLDSLATLLPKQVGAWTADSRDAIYDRNSIFDYIDGAGEVYLAYDMQGCLSRRYVSAGDTNIVLDIFGMGSSEDAFGVFTHDRDGEPVDIGQGALYRPGWLSFWKGRFFVSIYLEEETPAARAAVFQLGKAVNSLIHERGPKPKILLDLPPSGLAAASIRFFHHHTLLNYHYYLADENILHLGPETDVVLASYRREGKNALLLLVLYGDSGRAKEACGQFLAHYLPEAKVEEAIQLEDGKWSAAALKDNILAVVLESDSQAISVELLSEVTTHR